MREVTILVLLLLAVVTTNGQTQPAEAAFENCFSINHIDLGTVLPVQAPLGSFDFRTAVFQPNFTEPRPVTGLGCSAACRANGFPVSGLAMRFTEGEYNCYCGIAWSAFPKSIVETRGAECIPCGSINGDMCPANSSSVAIFVHTPSFQPISVVYENCYMFDSADRASITMEEGVQASLFGGGPLGTAQASTCLAQCAIHGFRTGGVLLGNTCWCFRNFPAARFTTTTCGGTACLLNTLADTFPAGTYDGLFCGGVNEIALYSFEGDAAPVASTVPDFALLPYSRTIGDPVDSPFQCIGMSNTFWQPVQASWLLGSPSSGSRITNGTFGVLSAQDTLTLSGNYEGGTIIYTCLVTSLSNNRVNSRTGSSPVSIDVYSVPTGDVVTTGVPAVGGSLSVTCINGGNGTGEDFSWSGRTSSNTARLTFVSATLEDQGDYNCSFRIQETQRRGLFTYNVVIYERPVVDLPETRSQAFGDFIRCSDFVTNRRVGIDMLTYEWTRPGGGVLAEDAVETSLPGMYTCTAINTVVRESGGTAIQYSGTDSVMVTIIQPPIAVVSESGIGETTVYRDNRNDNVVVLPGSSLILNCTEARATNVTFRWLISTGGETSQMGPFVNVDSTAITLNNVDLAQEGNYTCEVTNARIESSGRTQTTRTFVDVFVTPMLNFKATAYAIIGEPLELPCTFTGDVPDNFVWISPDNSENRSQALYFPDVTESTSGIYTCNISGFGVETSLLDTLLVYSDSRSVNLIAQIAPSATVPLLATTVAIGETLSLTCTASAADPASVEISWLRNGNSVADRAILTRMQENFTIEIMDFTQSDAGSYTCQVVDRNIGIPSRRIATATVDVETVGTDAQSSNDTPIIIGVVCGCVALILLVVLVAIILVQRKKKKKENTGADNPTYGEPSRSEPASKATAPTIHHTPGKDEIDGKSFQQQPSRSVPMLSLTSAAASNVSALYCEEGPTPEERTPGAGRHSFPPSRNETKKENLSPTKLHCVSSAEVLARVEDEDGRDDFQDFDADPDYNDPIKRRSFQAPGNDVDMTPFAVSNVTYELQSSLMSKVNASEAQHQTPEAVYSEPDVHDLGTHSRSGTLASYSHINFEPSNQYSVVSDMYQEPPDTEPAAYDHLSRQQSRQIHPDNIQLMGTFSYRHFGEVSRGIWKHGDVNHYVAVKHTSNEGSSEDRLKLLQEGVIMGQFQHENILHLLGLVLQGPLLMLVWESDFFEKGILSSVLTTLMPNPNERPRRSLKSILLKMTRSIASGMNYLSGKGFIHRDLAARNIIVDSKNSCKIGNFGMSRDLADREYYLSNSFSTSMLQLTTRWSAPEVLNSGQFSTASDVWSYGIVVFEIWSFGEKPYGDWSDSTITTEITNGYRLPLPVHCPPSLALLLSMCWKEDRSQRISFEEIVKMLSVKDVCLL